MESQEAAQPFLLSAYQHLQLNYPKYFKMDALAKLGWLAAEVLLGNNFAAKGYAAEEVSLVFCNRNSSLDADIRYYESVKTIPSPALFVYTLPNIVLGEICIRHGFKGENDFFIFDAFNPAFLQSYVSSLFDTGATKACICGWVELLGEAYKACIFLVEARQDGDAPVFSTQKIDHLYLETYG